MINLPDINANIARINTMSSQLGNSTGGAFQQLTPLTSTPASTPSNAPANSNTPANPNTALNANPTNNTSATPNNSVPNAVPNATPNATLTSYMSRISPTDISNFQPASDISNNLNINDTARAQAIAAQQSRLDAINKYYDSLVGNEQQAGADRMARTNAILASAGLMGSEGSVGQSRANTQATTNANIAKINEQRINAIGGFYNSIDSNMPAYIKALQTNASNQLNKIANDVQGAWQSLAQTTKMPFDKYMDYVNSNPQELETYNQMKQMSGMSDIQLHDLWNKANVPAGPQTTNINGQDYYAITDSKGNVTGWKPYPTAKTATTANTGFNLSLGQNRYDANGNLIASNPKVVTPVTPKVVTPKVVTPKAPTSSEVIKNAAKDMYSQITTSGIRGTDGYISPQDYKTAQQAWVSKGLSPKDFNTYFSIFANPSHLTDYGLK